MLHLWYSRDILILVIIMNEIAKKITDEMLAQNISYGELSELTGIPKSALFRYATGQTGKMPLPRLELIAKALHVEPSYLIGWEEKPAEEDLPFSQVTMIGRAMEKTTPEKREQMLQLLKVAFPEEFGE